jgi:hypothetical protein
MGYTVANGSQTGKLIFQVLLPSLSGKPAWQILAAAATLRKPVR